MAYAEGAPMRTSPLHPRGHRGRMTFVPSQQPKVMMRSGLSRLSQETLAILGVGIALAALMLTSISGLRTEIQAVRTEARADREAVRAEIQAVRVEARADRGVVRAEIQTVRAEARADREAMRTEARADREAIRAEAHADREALRAEARADREAFQSHILRLTEQQGVLSARLDGLSGPPAPSRLDGDRDRASNIGE